MKRLASYIALVAMLVVIALGATGTASATSINDWTSHTGPDYELYMAESGDVGAFELIQLINYDIHPITLELWQANGTLIMSHTVAPQSSEIIQLNYGIADCRIDIVSSYYGLEGSYTRTHAYELLPPPSDGNGWTIRPPAEKDPDLIYSAEDWEKMLAWMTMENVTTAALVMTIGAIIGAAIKRSTKFLKPTDVLSAAFLAVLGSDVMFRYLGEFDRIWYAPLAVGYIVGFLLWHIDYILPVRTDCKERVIDVRPVVVYQPEDGGGWCIQGQNNRALIKRWLGVPHRLGTDTGLTQDWVGSFKGPRGRRIRGRVIWIQKSEDTLSSVKVMGVRCEQRTTRFTLSHASGVEKAQWLNDVRWYYRLQDKYDRLALKYSDLLLGHRTEASEMGAEMAEHAVSVNPTHRVGRFFSSRSGPLDLETGENMTVIEDVNSELDGYEDKDSPGEDLPEKKNDEELEE